MTTPGRYAAAAVLPNLGVVIRRHRIAGGMTTRQLALASGISESTLSNIEANRFLPSISVYADISRALGLSPGVLLATDPRRAPHAA